MLSTFQLVNNDNVISPVLVTVREYGNWFQDTFDKYTTQVELYMRAKKKTGEIVLEWHPGTKIGAWFDSNKINDPKYKCWFIQQESPAMSKLVKLNLAEQTDIVSAKGQKLLRVYTLDQLVLYIRTNIDRNFDINQYLSVPKQVKLKDSDLGTIIMPSIEKKKKRLF